MPVLELDFEVYCSCGEGLCNQTIEGRTRGRGMLFITVSPCEKCLALAKEEGYEEGYSKGYDQATLDMLKEEV